MTGPAPRRLAWDEPAPADLYDHIAAPEGPAAMPAFTFTRTDTLARWTNLEGARLTASRLAELLERHGDKITVHRCRHIEQPTATLIAETFEAATGDAWEWLYVGDDRLKLEAAVATWLLIADDPQGTIPTTLAITEA